MEEYINRLLYYLPIDFDNVENNEYREYLKNACLENFNKEKYQFSLMGFHMLFMSFLYKEFWILKTFSYDKVTSLCNANGKFKDIERIFDASIVPEKDFIDNYLGVFKLHVNKKSNIKNFVDKRDHCAHNSGFVEVDKTDLIKYFDDVLKQVEQIAKLNEENVLNIFQQSLFVYINGTTFSTTSICDFINRELLSKKYSYYDLKHVLCNIEFKSKDNIKTVGFMLGMCLLQCLHENSEFVMPIKDFKANLNSYICNLETIDVDDPLYIQIEEEVGRIISMGYDMEEIQKTLEKRA